jgi:hypothetical protein
MRVPIGSACLDKIVSNFVKDFCVILISVCLCVLFNAIVGVSILFLVAWVYVIFCPPSMFCDAAELSFPYSLVFVI